MWKALGPNLNENNAERTAGTLETADLIYQSIDKDCAVGDHSSTRTSIKDDESVQQIVNDLVDNKAFVKTSGGEGYASFPKFERSLMHGLDYRDLHSWMQEHIDLWDSIYQWQMKQYQRSKMENYL